MILLDTHVWVWWVSSPEVLSSHAKEIVDNAMVNREIFISTISVWEVALLVAKGRLELTMDITDWIAKSEALPFINFISVDNNIAIKSITLPLPFHSDPADRIIIATAITLGVPIVTKDARIINYFHIQTIWE